MKKIVFVMLALLCALQIRAQEQTIDLLRKQLLDIQTEQRKELKQQIENINSMLENGVVNAEQAESLKLKAAEANARKIEERQAVILETIAFLEKKQSQQKAAAPVKDPNIFLDVDSYFSGGVIPPQNPPKKDSLFLKPSASQSQPGTIAGEGELKSPTTLDLVAAFGYNNAIEGSHWQDLKEGNRDFSLYGSHFLEFGLALKTPLTKENGLRIKYGISYQFNGLRPNNHLYFAEVDGLTQLQQRSFLTASGFNVNNLVVPVHLEFGPTKKKQIGNDSYYSASNQFKIGVGGYMGINLSAKQWIERPYFYHNFYWIGREEFKGYDVNKEIYGLSAYAGIGAFSIYGKYDLNTIFQNGAKDQQFVSLGLRLDL